MTSEKIKSILYSIIDTVGRVLNWMLFKVLLPKRYRSLTKKEIYEIIFKSDTPEGKRFDVWLLILILLNIVVMIVDSYAPLREGATWVRVMMNCLEWGFTLLFTFEYYLRVYCLRRPWQYALSFYGIIDFLSIFPAYLAIFFPAAHTLTVLRLLRTLRIFRIFKMQKFQQEGRRLLNSLRRSMVKILIFMLFVFIAAVILGAIVFAVEVDHNDKITSIPTGIYWAVVTLTTVGYGDIAPVTPLGQFIAVVVMILGYSIIAVPTGIVAGETIEEHRREQQQTSGPRAEEQQAQPSDGSPKQRAWREEGERHESILKMLLRNTQEEDMK